MVIDTGQIKAEMRRKGEERKKEKEDFKVFQNCNRNVKVMFSNIQACYFAWDAFITNVSGHCTQNLSSEQLEYT